jgi:flavorubredoxin
MHGEIEPGFYWIQECGPHRGEIADAARDRGETWCPPDRKLHVPQNAYLLRGERSLLFDTLSPVGGELIIDELDRILDGAALDYLVVSHPDVPHAGNTARILRSYPEARLVAPGEGHTHALYQLDQALKVKPGDEIDLGGPIVRFHEATFLDAALHLWMTEERTRTLFPVDWLGFPHLDGECTRFVDELDVDIGIERLTEFHSRVLFWFQYVDVDKTRAEVDHLARKFRPSRVAPAHGLVIRRDIERYFELMKDVVSRVAASGRVGVL